MAAEKEKMIERAKLIYKMADEIQTLTANYSPPQRAIHKIARDAASIKSYAGKIENLAKKKL